MHEDTPAPMTDHLTRLYAAAQGMALVAADVTAAAQALEQRHLAGMTAGAVLAEGLVAAGLLAADLAEADECVSLQLETKGPIGGLLVEASRAGRLRGYTRRKALYDLDGGEIPDVAGALGAEAVCRVIRSRPGRVLAAGTVAARPASVQVALAKYCHESLQRRVGVRIAVIAGTRGIARACGILAERLPDGDVAAFVHVLEQLERGGVETLWDAPGWLPAARDRFGLPGLAVTAAQPLAFGCRCSRERVAAMLRVLPPAEQAALLGDGQPHTVHCHMCGAGYTIEPQDVQAILASAGPSIN